jgi:hypothetical protein
MPEREQPSAAGQPVTDADADAARLFPLGHEHINLLGRYAFPRPARATTAAGAA